MVTRRGNLTLVRVEDFEMLDHPVTNAEYKRFVDATRHEAPAHWNGSSIPPGMENDPVVNINRYDADEYVEWLAGIYWRACRLPTDAEFEYAARGGLERKLNPWAPCS